MSRKSKLLAIVMVVLGLCLGMERALGQAETSNMTVRPEASEPAVAYRLDYSLNELDDGKKINTRQYSMNLNAGDANSIKIGARVPVEAKNGEFQYLDIGTNIWSRLKDRANTLTLEVRADVSNIGAPDQQSQASRPVVRQVQINASTVVLPGKPMTLGVVDDPSSKRQFQLEVTVTKLR
jgi:hypothetical protein